MVAVGPGAPERFVNGLRVLRGEQHPQNLAAIAAMFENLLADELLRLCTPLCFWTVLSR